MSTPRVKITAPTMSPYDAIIEVDGKPLDNIVAIDVHIDRDMPVTAIVTLEPDEVHIADADFETGHLVETGYLEARNNARGIALGFTVGLVVWGIALALSIAYLTIT